MKRDDIIRMAREAGFGLNSLGVTFTSGYLDDHLERFAALVAIAERKECAAICKHIAAIAEHNQMVSPEEKEEFYSSRHLTADDCADLILARSNHD